MFTEFHHRVGRERLEWQSMSNRLARQEIVGQKFNVFGPLTKRLSLQRDYRQSIIEILAESAGCDFGREISVRGSDHTDIDRLFFMASHGYDHSLLEHAEQLGLYTKIEFAHLVEEDGCPRPQHENSQEQRSWSP